MGIKRIMFVVGLGAGYIIGARAGRERYEQIVSLAQRAATSEPAQRIGNAARTQLDEASENIARLTGQIGERSREIPGKLVHTAESLRDDLKRRAGELGESIDDVVGRGLDLQAQRLLGVAELHSDAIDELESDEDTMIDSAHADERNLNQN